MIRILQISDIHFKRLPDAKDEYTQLKERLYEKVEEIVKDLKIDCILICGDVAFSGNPDEYEQKAKVFINRLRGIIQYEAAQVYMVPGNHDKNRDAKYTYLLNNHQDLFHIDQIYTQHIETVQRIIVMLRANSDYYMISLQESLDALFPMGVEDPESFFFGFHMKRKHVHLQPLNMLVQDVVKSLRA